MPFIVIAPWGQDLTQIPQAIQPTEQAFITSLPLHCDEQAIYTGADTGILPIMPLGQAVMHAPQDTHLSGSIFASLPSTLIAFSGQTALQSPQPRQA